MDWIGLLETAFIITIALATAQLLVRRFGIPPFEGRFREIDGLRGFLALFVFVSHSAIWRAFATTGIWKNGMSDLFDHLGHDSVRVFFMITGFLFFSKLLEARNGKFDWIRLYVSRILRLYPLYLLAMAMYFLTTAKLVSFKATEPWILILEDVMQWLGFSLMGAPMLCGISHMVVLVGVVWTLVYEWTFYFSLPLQALCLGMVPPVFFIAMSIAALFFWGHFSGPIDVNWLSFAAGMTASVLVRSEMTVRLARHWLATAGIIACIAITLAFKSREDQSILLLAPLAVIFALIACGNDMFGMLVAPAARMLGNISYSIYLLHLLFLHAFFRFALGKTRSAGLSIAMHWLSIDILTPFFIILCFCTWRWIEKPPMRYTAQLTSWVRNNLTLRGLH